MAKKSIIIILLCLLILGCVQDALQMGGGTLGATATEKFNCSERKLKDQLLILLTEDSFKVSESDSTILDQWKSYDFLNFVCINIQGTLYMASLTSDNFNESELSIRSYYNRNKAEWIFAVDFSKAENKKAKQAQTYLRKQIHGCN